MLRLLQWLFLGHLHTWEEVRQIKVFDRDRKDELPAELRVYCRCKKCGLPKSFLVS